MTEVFLDTSFAIALSSVTDQNHVRAVQLANQIETNKTRLVTTQAILLEIGNALSKQRHRVAAIQLLESLETDPLEDRDSIGFLPGQNFQIGSTKVHVGC
jgi:predicted nucleic acid-binding protein